jgi:hypothetical protein
LLENLWEARTKMTRASFAIVWTIFLVNVVWEFFILQTLPTELQPMLPGLMLVFVLGIILATFEFVFAFIDSNAKGHPIKRGDECCSTSLRSDKHEGNLAVISPWFQVFTIDSFVFFGTADRTYQQLKAHLQRQTERGVPRAERVKTLVFDLSGVTGIDPTAEGAFFKMRRLLDSEGVTAVWAEPGVSRAADRLEGWLDEGAERFASLDLALKHVEDELLAHAQRLSEKWMENPTAEAIRRHQLFASVFSISVRPTDPQQARTSVTPSWVRGPLLMRHTGISTGAAD